MRQRHSLQGLRACWCLPSVWFWSHPWSRCSIFESSLHLRNHSAHNSLGHDMNRIAGCFQVQVTYEKQRQTVDTREGSQAEWVFCDACLSLEQRYVQGWLDVLRLWKVNDVRAIGVDAQASRCHFAPACVRRSVDLLYSTEKKTREKTHRASAIWTLFERSARTGRVWPATWKSQSAENSPGIQWSCFRTWSSTLESANFSVDSRSSQGFIVSFASSGIIRFKPCTLPRSVVNLWMSGGCTRRVLTCSYRLRHKGCLNCCPLSEMH